MTEPTSVSGITEVRITVRSPRRTRVTTTVTVPNGPVRPSDIVPALHRIGDALVAAEAEAVGGSGAEVSCRAGCGACCRQLVPVLESEARFLVDVVGSLAPEHRSRVLGRWRTAITELEKYGLLGPLRRIRTQSRRDRRTLVVRYFRLGIPCPFLEDESCSIHEDRPLVCREYLVTSPPEACAGFGDVPVEKVPMPVSLFTRLLAAERANPRWVPLVFAFDRVVASPEPQPTRLRGSELLSGLLGAEMFQSGGAEVR